jgi:hypothetical protein
MSENRARPIRKHETDAADRSGDVEPRTPKSARTRDSCTPPPLDSRRANPNPGR